MAGRPEMKSDPITVVGAGPAGLTCATVLAQAGRRVIVREWHPKVGSRFNGDFQGLENWSDQIDILQELASAGIGIRFDLHPVYGGTAFDAWGNSYQVESAEPIYYLVHRGSEPGSLDQGLLATAREAGADVRFDDRIETVDGPAVLAIGPRVADAIAVGYVFETGMEDGDWIWFDNRLAPLGYAYLLVHGGQGTVATCLFKDFKHEAGYLERTVDAFRARVGLDMRHPRPFGGYANFRLPRTGVQGGHLLVGEQAGFQDALAGFGMRYALRSGILAAQSLIAGKAYDEEWHRALLPALRASVSNRWIFNMLGDRGWAWMLRHRLSNGDARAELRRLYEPSFMRRLAFPMASRRFRAHLRDRNCDHVDCTCVWCRCGAAAHGNAPI